jgi:hypothetical protein
MVRNVPDDVGYVGVIRMANDWVGWDPGVLEVDYQELLRFRRLQETGIVSSKQLNESGMTIQPLPPKPPKRTKGEGWGGPGVKGMD